MFKRSHCWLLCVGEVFKSVLLLAMRLYWGFGFFQSGFGKLADIGGTAQFFSELGIPFPIANAYMAGGIECFGGLFLMAGLFSRFVSFPLIVVMLVAYWTAHKEALVNIWSSPDQFVASHPFNYLLTALIVLAFGPGKLSLDYLICRVFFQKRCTDQDNDPSCQA